MYDMAIPKLYETITIKEDKENQKQLAYGHSNWFTSRIGRSNRKDRATTFTCKLVFEHTPRVDLKYYRGVEVIVWTTGLSEPKIFDRDPVAQNRPLDAQMEAWKAHITLLADFAAQAAQNRISTPPLHIVEHVGHGYGWMHRFNNFASTRSGWAPTTYKVVYEDPDFGTSRIGLATFYLMRSVVRFSASGGYDSRWVEQLATGIDSCFNPSFPWILPSSQNSPGRLFLCGIPALVLSPEELIAAGDKANEVAKLKVFEALSAMAINYGTRPTWEAYNSGFHFVNPGFRPTLADLTEN